MSDVLVAPKSIDTPAVVKPKRIGVRNIALLLFLAGTFGAVIGWMLYLANNFAFGEM